MAFGGYALKDGTTGLVTSDQLPVLSASTQGPHRSTPATYISGTGTAGTDNTAMTLKTVVFSANTLTQVGDRMRIRSYFAATAGAADTGTTSINSVAVADTAVSGTSLAVTECWLHYIDATHANIIESGGGPLLEICRQ